MTTEQNTYVMEQDFKFTASLQLHEAVMLVKIQKKRGSIAILAILELTISGINLLEFSPRLVPE